MNRWIAVTLVGVVAGGFAFRAFPRYETAAHLGYTLDREEFIARARDFAASHGIDVSGREGYAMAGHNRSAQLFRLEHSNDPLARVLPAGTATVAFALPGNKVASVEFTSDGQLNTWKLPTAAVAKPGDPATVARQALHDIAGDAARFFPPTMPGRSIRDGTEFAWQWNEKGTDARIRITAVVKNGYARQGDKDFTPPNGFSKTHDNFPAWRAIPAVAWWVALFACIFPMRRGGAADLVRGMKERSVLVLSIVFGALGGGLNSILAVKDAETVISGDNGMGQLVLGSLLGGVFLAVFFFLIMASLVANARPHASRVRGLRLAGTADFFTRGVASEALGGLIAAPLLIAIPLVFAALFRARVFTVPPDSLVLNPAPALYSIADAFNQETLILLGLFGCMIPMALRLKIRWLKVLAVIVFAVIAMPVYLSPFPSLAAGDWLVWAATGLAMLWIYGHFGVLGAIAAFQVSRMFTNAGVLLTQPAAAMHASGITAMALIAGFGAVGLAIAVKGRESDRRLFGEAAGREFVRTRREELLAEFNVARSAQQQMLPAKPPELEGYTLSASCDPAREVGGDLYDFVRLKDGRWAIGVADVSGKGVPAALYMTLTKGLLCAAAEDASDPRSILAAVNTHLREVTKKKMFVTMALGALDLESRTVEYVRAGHNPIVWRRAAAGETKLLTPGGIGLGIAPPALFSKTLAIEKIDLEPGDALVFYSDGLTEAMDSSLEQFGEERLMDVVSRADGLDAEATRDTILRTVKEFLGGGHPQDDLTIAVLRAGRNRR